MWCQSLKQLNNETLILVNKAYSFRSKLNKGYLWSIQMAKKDFQFLSYTNFFIISWLSSVNKNHFTADVFQLDIDKSLILVILKDFFLTYILDFFAQFLE